MADLIGVKLVVVGDVGVGKTCLLAVFAKGKFPTKSVPTTYDNYVMDLEVDGTTVELGLWDTPGNGDYDRLRPLIYPKSHVVLLCFAVDCPKSLENARTKWVSEIRHHRPDVPIVLLGCKNDLREGPRGVEVEGHEIELVSIDEARLTADSIGAAKYLQCSAKTLKGVQEVFQYAARLSLQPKWRKSVGKRKDCSIL